MDPTQIMQILSQVAPRARSEDELVEMAANLSPPPSAGFRPAGPPLPTNGVSGFATPPQQPIGAQLAAGGGLPNLVPPMTQNENRTRPDLGSLLVGG